MILRNKQNKKISRSSYALAIIEKIFESINRILHEEHFFQSNRNVFFKERPIRPILEAWRE